ncbi:MAG: outer-membrane lipoprotein carrier protein LolA [Mariprofundus sp.]|nr:outer-membrane lipoprotein carrier protein LolA [Mariprofundus sp.]
MKGHRLILLFLLLVCASSASATTVKQEWQLDGYQKQQGDFFEKSIKRMGKLPGFSCRFDQLMVFSDGGDQHYAGTLAILKPKRFRWQYEKPYAQLYLGDGQSIWHYEPDLMQAERLNNLEAVDPTVMRLLNGRIKLSAIKVLKQEYDKKLDIRRFQVSMEKSPKVWLGFSKYGDLVYIERQDMLGNRNRMRLSKCSYIAPAANLFRFTPPADVDVLDLRSGRK